MRRFEPVILLSAALLLASIPETWCASVSSRTDTRALSALAPPAYETNTSTYGDKAVSRRVASRRRRSSEAPPFGAYPCDAESAASHRCTERSSWIDEGHGYVFAPAYVTAPQVAHFRYDERDALLPPATAFFYGINDRLFGR